MNTMLSLLVSEIHDVAHEAWNELHSDTQEREHYDCKLCGATMYACQDYTHKPDCPAEQITAAIDAFGKACEGAA